MTVIRPAEVSDGPALADILQDWIEATPWMPQLHTRKQTHAFLDRLIATADVTVAEGRQLSGFLAHEGGEVPAFYVAAHARGQGIGSTLIRGAQRASPRLQLWTFQANSGALGFYSRHGFRELVRTDGAGNDEKLPDVRLDWSR